MKKYSKLKHQIKSTPYYIFWATETIAVVIRQIYVGYGYRQMSEEVKTLNQAMLETILLLNRKGGL